MLAFFLTDLLRTGSPILVLVAIFAVWMLVDAIRRGDWLWAILIFIFPVLNPFLYYFLVYRQSPPDLRGLELPGVGDRRRIQELRDRIQHLDKAHDHLALGDLLLEQGRIEEAEASYRAAIERDPEDPDARAHLGECLLRRGRPAEALPWLEQVAAGNPTHDFGNTLMALAETRTALGQPEAAIATWRQVLENHTHARARAQLAELLADQGQTHAARAEARTVVEEEAHTPVFQRRRDQIWIRRARALLQRLEAS